ncbi:MAG: phosphate ABC transporter substrate-binding protein PstS [Chloroflexota bacterium]|nr:phosphate ABC transporter substrate-binding protein PstS [Chloroflexota bacterium]
MPRRAPSVVAVSLALIAAAACAPAAGDGLSTELTGAGASFPAPVYLEWIGAFREDEPGVTINYRSIGSSGGRIQFIALQVDFAGTDSPMSDDEIAAAREERGCDPLHIPTVFGGVAIAYNIGGVDQLVLDGPTIAQIALGNITLANDPRIAALNPGVALPADALTWVHRSDGSGTTSIFTRYLASVSPEWEEEVGAGSEVDWPTGIGGDQNDGVAAIIGQQPGGIGYVSYEYAAETGLAVAAVVNADGTPILPSSDSISLAAADAEVPEDFRFGLLDIGGDGYPIVGATWILAWTCGYTPVRAEALRAFLRFGLEHGDDLARELNYAPLPPTLEARVLAHIERINERG